jgi:hypothetical protein
MDKNEAKMSFNLNKLSEPELLKKIATDTNPNENKLVSTSHTSSTTKSNNMIPIGNTENMDENNNELGSKNDENQQLADNKESPKLDFTKKRSLVGLPLLCCAYFSAIYCLVIKNCC